MITLTAMDKNKEGQNSSLDKSYDEFELKNAIFDKYKNEFNFVLNEYNNLCITNNQGVIKYVNEKFCETTSYKNDELVGSTHKKLNSSFHDKSFYKELWDTILNGKPWRGDIRNKDKYGNYYWLDTIIYPLLNTDGEIEEFLAIKKNITKQKELELQLKNALEEKEILLKELHHRVKNNFSLLISLINLRYKQCEENPEAISVETMCKDLESKIHSMVRLHESLYLGDNLSEICANDFIENISQHIIEAQCSKKDKVKFTSSIKDQICLSIKRASTLALVINEIITNSCKYAFIDKENENEISVELSKVNDKTKVVVGDNGKGFSKKDIKKHSLGNILIQALTKEQLKGSINLISNKKGTVYEIVF